MSPCATSTLLVFHEAHHPAIYCILQRYDEDDFLRCISNKDDQTEGAKCVHEIFQHCFGILNTVNELMSRHSDNADADERLIEDFSGLADGAATILQSESAWFVKDQRRILWLGELSRTGRWKGDGSYLPQSLMRAVQNTIDLKPPKATSTVTPGAGNDSPRNRCSKFSTNLFLDNSQVAASSHTGIEYSRCSPTIVVVGFQSDFHYKIAELLLVHPFVLPPLHSYFSSENLKAFMNTDPVFSGDDFSMNSEYPLTPMLSSYSISGEIRHLLQRAWRFPFVQPHEFFRVLDASALYGTSFEAPKLFKLDDYRDNKKVVFAVSDPVHRWERQCVAVLRHLSSVTSPSVANDTVYTSNVTSNMRPTVPGLTCDDIAELGMSQGSSFSRLRMLLSNSSASKQDLLTSYYRHVNKHSDAISAFDSLFVESLAVFPLWYYQSVFGLSRVLVVDADDLAQDPLMDVRPHERRNQLEQIFSFAEISSEDVDWSLYSDGAGFPPSSSAQPVSHAVHDEPKASKNFPYQYLFQTPWSSSSSSTGTSPSALSVGTGRRLRRFFAPFVSALAVTSGLNLTRWLPSTTVRNNDVEGGIISRGKQLWRERSSKASVESQLLESLLAETGQDRDVHVGNSSASMHSSVGVLIDSSEDVDDFETWFDVIDTSNDHFKEAEYRFNFVSNLLPIK
jgi:hypothetical protein